LFIDERKVNKDIVKELSLSGIKVLPYESIEEHLGKILPEETVLLDSDRVNSKLYDAINKNCKKVEEPNVTTKLKAIKNDIEIKNLRNCLVRDGVAMVKFLYWLDTNIGKTKITEISASDKLEEFRSQQKYYMGLSFDTIAGYKEHAAMMHYKATSESDYELKAEGMYLVDSGGQYLDGTTDITRTIVLGKLTKEEKCDFTLTLKGNIALSRAVFLYGSTGSNVDILARLPLWEHGIDYKCGTGHGVGFFLNVHEGPQGLRQTPNNITLEKGMILTNEPGVYKEGRYGIRLENMMVVVEGNKTESGQFMGFDAITYCPFDLDGVEPSLLSDKERKWLNDYHKKVYAELSPYLDDCEKEWLERETRAI
jgi:Xaa-Pro aminopeptidase